MCSSYRQLIGKSGSLRLVPPEACAATAIRGSESHPLSGRLQVAPLEFDLMGSTIGSPPATILPDGTARSGHRESTPDVSPVIH